MIEKTVTFVRTGVAAAGDILKKCPQDMPAALKVHDECLAKLIEQHHGSEVSREDKDGSCFTVAFESPANALKWCKDVQSQLMLQPWPSGLETCGVAECCTAEKDGFKGLRVRMAIHLGFPPVEAHSVHTGYNLLTAADCC